MKRLLTTVLTALLLALGLSASPAAAQTTFTFTLDNAHASVIDDRLFAVLLSEPRPSSFTTRPVAGGVLIEVTGTDRYLAAVETDAYTQIQAVPLFGQAPPDAVWRVRDAHGRVVDDITGDGAYFIEHAASGMPLGRSHFEDTSMMPKRVMVLPVGYDVSPVRVTVIS